jgi:hypothetical protein
MASPSSPTAGRPAALVAGLLLAAGCGPALQPGVTPSPDEPPAGVPTPATTAAPAFAYGPGSAVALVESRATIQVADDSSAAQDTVVTTVRVRWQIGEAGADGDRPLTAVVDSFTVRAGSRVPGAVMPLPVRVAGVARGGRVELGAPVGPPAPVAPAPIAPAPPPRPATPTPPTPSAPADDSCGAPAAAVLGSVRELFPRLPAQLAAGARWTDTTTTTSCPGGVRLEVTAIHRYAVTGEAEVRGRRAARVERASDVVVRGAGEQARQPVTADGRGTGRATLLVDVAAGTLVDLAGTSTLELTFTGAGRTQRVVQQATTSVRVP